MTDEDAVDRIATAMLAARGEPQVEGKHFVGYFDRGPDSYATADDIRVLQHAISAMNAETGEVRAVLPTTVRIEEVNGQDAVWRMARAAWEESKLVLAELEAGDEAMDR